MECFFFKIRLHFVIQVESYKSDFNAERQSLQKEKERNQKMSEELQQLRDSNKLLQEEVDVLRREMYGPGRAPQTCAPSTCYMPPPPVSSSVCIVYRVYRKCRPNISLRWWEYFCDVMIYVREKV